MRGRREKFGAVIALHYEGECGGQALESTENRFHHQDSESTEKGFGLIRR
ncbi:MAG: hypothetical protein QOE88_225, partial [Verrucomicrobiota bacterium]|nr:hypothetical protein [Verrucomicrobiota bacterium]